MGDEAGADPTGSSLDDEPDLDAALRTARADEYRTQFVTGPVGLLASTATLAALTWNGLDRTLLLMWTAFMFCVAVAIAAAQAPWAWRRLSADGIPMAAQYVHVLAGFGWGLALWLPLAGDDNGALVWVALTLAVAVTAGASAGLSGANTLGRNLVIALWSAATPALLMAGEVTMAAAGVVYAALMLHQIRASRVSWESLVRVRTRWEHEAAIRERAALSDSLTGLRNRAGLRDDFARLTPGQSRGVIFFDLDDFKSINDHWGHLVGDGVLTVVGRRLREASPPDAIVARPGGDEFVVVLAATDEIAIRQVERRLTEHVRVPIDDVAPSSVSVGASGGVAYDSTGRCELDALLRTADDQLYVAKRSRHRPSVSLDSATG